MSFYVIKKLVVCESVELCGHPTEEALGVIR
jgi:hypothetical protein